ncbi:MAG: lipopolysaccharide biosynthesis protein [Marmoricola sp.]
MRHGAQRAGERRKPRRHVAEGASATASHRDRAVLRSALTGVIARVATAGGSVIGVAMAARSLTAAELGVTSILTMLVVYFGFADFGMSTLLMTRLPAAHARDDHEQARELVGSVLSAMLVVSSVVAVFGIASVYVLPWRRLLGAGSIAPGELDASLIVFVLTGAAGIVGMVGSRVLASMQQGATVQIATAVAAVGSVAAVGLCVAIHAALWGYVLAFAGPPTLSGLVQLVLAFVRFPSLAGIRHTLGLRSGLGVLRSGLEYGILSAGWVVAYTLDAIVVSSILGAAAAAVFGIATRLFSLIAGTLTVAGQQMWPAMADALARGEVDWVRARFRRSLQIAGGTAALSCLFLLVAGQTIARLWVGDKLVPPFALFVVLAVWTVYMTVITQYSYMLMAADRIRLLAGIGIVIALVNIGVSIAFTHWIGMTGPIVGNLVAAVLIQWGPMVLMTRRLMRDFGPAQHAPVTVGMTGS